MTEQSSSATEAAEAGALPIIAPARIGRPRKIDMRLSATEPDAYAAACDQLSVRLDRAERRISMRGELDMASAPVLAGAMDTLIDLEPADGTIDLTAVSFIDAAGLSCLVDLANRLAARDAKISVVGASPRLRRVFDLAQLGGLLQAP